MRTPDGFLCFVCVCLVAIAMVQPAVSQDTPPVSQAARIDIQLTDLFPPRYPPLARQARITGDVRLKLEIRKDGSVESADVISGHVMLKQAALDSAQKSKFSCSGCVADLNSYVLTYTFGLRSDNTADCRYARQRSMKCLKMWKCGGWNYLPQDVHDAIGQSLDRIVILGYVACVNTETSSPSSAE